MEGYGKGRKGGERKGRNGKGIHSGLDLVPLLFGGSTPMVLCTTSPLHDVQQDIKPASRIQITTVLLLHRGSIPSTAAVMATVLLFICEYRTTLITP